MGNPKMRKEVGWGIINGKTLIYPSIRTTRYDAIKDHLRGIEPFDGNYGSPDRPTRSWLREFYPHLDVVKVAMFLGIEQKRRKP